MITFEIVVRELNNYKEARITLPNSRYIEELTKEFGENWIEHDYEIVDVEDDYNILHSYKVYGYESLERLNKLAIRIEEVCIDNYRLKIIEAAAEVYTNIDEVLELIESEELELYENQSPEELAEWFVNEGWLGEVSEKIQMYIDYEKLGRDIMMDGNYYETKHGILEERR